MPVPVLYVTLGSPDAYLAVERAEYLLPCVPELEPVLLGTVFQYRGWGSWAAVRGRRRREAEFEQRARAHGLPPVVWPPTWPGDAVAAMRAVTWAKGQHCAWEFAQALFRRQFGVGADLGDLSVVMECAAETGLEPSAMMTAIHRGEVKRALRQATQRAWDDGVRGVPALRIGAVVFSGPDQLEAARRHLAG